MSVLDRFLRWLALAAGGVLLALMFFTVCDVVLRYFFNSPFRGSLELTEYAMALIVFFSLAYCGWTGGHIAVDLLDKWLDRPSLRYLPALMTLLGGILFAVVAWEMAVEAIAAIDQTSNMMRIPHFPFRMAGAFGSAAFSLVMLVQTWQLIVRPQQGQHQSETQPVESGHVR